MCILLRMSIADVSAQARTAAFDFASQDFQNAQVIDSIRIDQHLLISLHDGSRVARYYTDGRALRIYSNGYLRVRIRGAEFDSIKFYFQNANYTFAEDTPNPALWDPDKAGYSRVDFHCRRNQCRIRSMEVYYTISNPADTFPPIYSESSPVQSLTPPRQLQADRPSSTAIQVRWDAGQASDAYVVHCAELDTARIVETFAFNTGTGGNDGLWNGSIASKRDVFTDLGWTCMTVYGADNCLRLGTSTSAGRITSPRIQANEAEIRFQAGAWTGDSDSITVSTDHGYLTYNGRTSDSVSVDITPSAFAVRQVALRGVTDTAHITFAGRQGNKSRFFIDNIELRTRRFGALQEVQTAATDYTFDNLNPGQLYAVRVSTMRDGRQSDFTEWIPVPPAVQSSIQLMYATTLTADHNRILNPEGVQVYLYDMQGYMLLQTQQTVISMPPGAYLVRSVYGVQKMLLMP